MASDWELLESETRGSVTALAAASSNLVYATTPVGVYRSDDAARTWNLPTADTSVAFGECVAVVGEDVFVGSPEGLYRSADHGEAWQRVLIGSRVTAVCARAGVVLAGTDTDGLLRSEDAGRTWSGANAGLLDLDVLAIALSPEFGSDGLGFVGTTSGLFRTRNRGQSWRIVDIGLVDAAVQCAAVGPNRLVVAGTEADGLVWSQDGGATWQAPRDLVGRSVTAVAISRCGAVAAAADVGMFVSVDSGESWRLHATGPGGVLSLLYLGDSLYAAAEGSGVWRSRDNGASWTAASTGLHASLLSSMAVSADGTLWLGGSAEGVRAWHDATWQERNAGLLDSVVLGLSASVDGSVLAATPHGIYVWRGAEWQATAATEPVGAVVATRRIFAIGGGVAVSNDFGRSWRPLDTPFSVKDVISVATDGQSVVVATSAVVWRTADDGDHWDLWFDFAGAVAAIALAPDAAIFVGTHRGVSVSRDRGNTFTALGGPARVISLALAADGGLYALELGGRVWRRVNRRGSE
jgi:ligand-binding sensor domain-containing protein